MNPFNPFKDGDILGHEDGSIYIVRGSKIFAILEVSESAREWFRHGIELKECALWDLTIMTHAS